MGGGSACPPGCPLPPPPTHTLTLTLACSGSALQAAVWQALFCGFPFPGYRSRLSVCPMRGGAGAASRLIRAQSPFAHLKTQLGCASQDPVLPLPPPSQPGPRGWLSQRRSGLSRCPAPHCLPGLLSTQPGARSWAVPPPTRPFISGPLRKGPLRASRKETRASPVGPDPTWKGMGWPGEERWGRGACLL